MHQPKIALVHDYLWTLGGAEKVIEALAEAYPEAPIYTSFILPEKMLKEGFKVDLKRVRTTWMQYLPFKRQLYKVYFLLYPLAFRGLHLKGYDIVLSSSSYAAIHTTVSKGTTHICYCHTPSRYIYGYDTELDHSKIKKYLPFMTWVYKLVKKWDQEASRRVDFFITNSNEVDGRVQKHYQKRSTVIYPPVEMEKFKQLEPTDEGYYFTYGRLVSHKRVDLIVAAFNDLGWPLKVAGNGLEYGNLKQLAKSNIEMLGRVDDEQLKKLMAGCKAVIFAAEEDFGIVPVEAMAAGKPVIAYQAGGVLESVHPGRTGEFFHPQTADALKKVLEGFDPKKYDSNQIRKHAEMFDKQVFISSIRQFVQKVWEKEAIVMS